MAKKDKLARERERLAIEAQRIAVERARRELEEAKKGPIRRAVEKEVAEVAARAVRPSKPVEHPRPVTIAISPPAYQTPEAKPVLPMVSLGQLGRTIVTAGVGSVVTAAFITTLQGGNKYVGALIGASVGTMLIATSPAASIPSDLGIGMLAGAAGWAMLKWTDKVQ